MEAHELSPQAVESIVTGGLAAAAVTHYCEWHQGLDPSFRYLRHLLQEYLTAHDCKILRAAAQAIPDFFHRIPEFKLPRTFLRAYLAILHDHLHLLAPLPRMQEVFQAWSVVSIDILEEYLHAFGIGIEGRKSEEEPSFMIPRAEVEARLDALVEKKEYDSAMRLIQLLGYPEPNLEALFAHMVANREASKAANFIKTHKLDAKRFPLINRKLNKNMIKYFLNSVGWDAAEEIFEAQPEALWNLVQDLLAKKKVPEAKSVWSRNRDLLGETGGLSKETIAAVKEWSQESEEQISSSLVANPYFSDYFGPSDKERHLSLQDFNISEEQVYFLNKPEAVDKFITRIQNAKECAIDTESIVGKTKLDRQKDEPPSIIQVAFDDQAYIIDCNNCPQKAKEALLSYLSSDRLLLGHALENDLQGVLLGLGLSSEQRRAFRFGRVVDTCKLFKAIHPNERHCNLAHISLKVLGREVCKRQTLTNWARRPLRRNQLHYAALDAVAVIFIYRKLEEEVGVNMLTYFLEEL